MPEPNSTPIHQRWCGMAARSALAVISALLSRSCSTPLPLVEGPGALLAGEESGAVSQLGLRRRERHRLAAAAGQRPEQEDCGNQGGKPVSGGCAIAAHRSDPHACAAHHGDKRMIAGDGAVERLIASSYKSLHAEIVDVLHRRETIGAGVVAGKDHLVVLRIVDREGSDPDREELMLVAELRIEQIRRQRAAGRIVVMRVADPAGQREIEAVLEQHRDRTVQLLAAIGGGVGSRRPVRRAVCAAEADAAGAGRDAGIAVSARLGMATAVGEDEPQRRCDAEIVVFPREPSGQVERAAVEQRSGELEAFPKRGVVADADIAAEPVKGTENAGHGGSVGIRRRQDQGSARAARHYGGSFLAKGEAAIVIGNDLVGRHRGARDRKSTRLNSSHTVISYAVFCLKKKKNHNLYYYRISDVYLYCL